MALETLTMKADDLVLGDEVRLLEGPYGWGTVVQIKDDEVHIFRPYVHIGDFSYTGGVLYYIGSELIKVWRGASRVFTVDAYTHNRMAKEGALK